MIVKRARLDNYLKKFRQFCLEKFGDELVAIGVYGSFGKKYFSKKKSDYDVFLIFRDKVLRGKTTIKKRFPKISLQYFCTLKELGNRINLGHFTIYITLLKDAKMLYFTNEYKNFLREIKKIGFLEKMADTLAMQAKTNFEIKSLKDLKGYSAIKWAFPSIRKRLQFLTYVRKKRILWNLNKVLTANKSLLNSEERKFILKLNKELNRRGNSFSKKDERRCIDIIKKLNSLIIKELT